MTRGNNKQPIFFDDLDYRFFYKLLGKMVALYGCKIHLFCLMTNHVHMVVEVGFVPLSKIMQCIQSEYTGYVNRRYKRCNHLFGGRFRSKKVCTVAYFIELCHYIHLNPVKAQIVSHVDQYKWSSHLCYAKKKEVSWLATDLIYSLLNEAIAAANPYASFIYEREKFYDTPAALKLDQDGFLVQIKPLPDQRNEEKKLNLSRLSLNEIIQVICQTMDVSVRLLISDARIEKVVLARSMVAYYGHYFGGYQFNHIAPVLFRDPKALSKTMHKTINSSSRAQDVAYWMKSIEQAFWLKLIELSLSH
jgi:REP element-mobilizing transposase RayT